MPLYPKITPYNTGMLPVGDGHVMYYEESGNPDGMPMLNIHGGPGSGLSEGQRQHYNPQKYRLIQYDQRGCGKSTPFASLENNTTPRLIEDIETLRKHLGIDTWHVSGGSWGSTLAMAYTDAYPEHARSLVIRGIFLGRQCELDNMYMPGGIVSQIFPDIFEPFYNLIPDGKRDNPVIAYREMFLSDDISVRDKALEAWTKLEATVSMLQTSPEDIEKYLSDKDLLLTHSLMENHYFMSQCFIDGDAILSRIGAKTAGMAVHIVQGRYDMVCPFQTAWEIHKATPHSRLHIIGDAGHSAREPGAAEKLIEIFDGL